GSECNLLQVELHSYFKIGAWLSRCLAASRLAAAAAKDITKFRAKNVAKVAEDIFKTSAAAKTGRSVYTLMPELVVTLPFLIIPQHLIRLRSFLKLSFSFGIILVSVGMIFHRLLPIGLFYFL